MHTPEKSVVTRVQSEVDCVMTTAETRIQDAVLFQIENLVIPRVELAMKSVIASCRRGLNSVVLDPDLRGVSGIIEGFQATASRRINSNTDLFSIDETRGNFMLQGGYLTVVERNFDRQAHTHHVGVDFHLWYFCFQS